MKQTDSLVYILPSACAAFNGPRLAVKKLRECNGRSLKTINNFGLRYLPQKKLSKVCLLAKQQKIF